MSVPLIYRRIREISRSYAQTNRGYEINRNMLSRKISNGFRLRKAELDQVFIEMERMKLVRRSNRRNIKIL